MRCGVTEERCAIMLGVPLSKTPMAIPGVLTAGISAVLESLAYPDLTRERGPLLIVPTPDPSPEGSATW